MKAKKLIGDLIELTNKNIEVVQSFKTLPVQKLRYKQNAESWSILECIEHLNRYGDFYIPEIKKRMQNANYMKSDSFKSGVLGSYFVKSMLPKENLNKMKAFSTMNPQNCTLNQKVLDKFILQQKEILILLDKSRDTNLTRIKTSISISKWIKLKLGNTFRVIVYHNLRHIVQAKRVLKSQEV